MVYRLATHSLSSLVSLVEGSPAFLRLPGTGTVPVPYRNSVSSTGGGGERAQRTTLVSSLFIELRAVCIGNVPVLHHWAGRYHWAAYMPYRQPAAPVPRLVSTGSRGLASVFIQQRTD
jgi:hypothetical protein